MDTDTNRGDLTLINARRNQAHQAADILGDCMQRILRANDTRPTLYGAPVLIAKLRHVSSFRILSPIDALSFPRSHATVGPPPRACPVALVLSADSVAKPQWLVLAPFSAYRCSQSIRRCHGYQGARWRRG